jgi:hypothetical protein
MTEVPGLAQRVAEFCAASVRGWDRSAAWPIAKQGPETRAADCPPWVIEAQRPAT